MAKRITQEEFLKVKDLYLKGFSLKLIAETNGFSLSTLEKKKKRDEKLSEKWIKGSERMTYYELINGITEEAAMQSYIKDTMQPSLRVDVTHLTNIKKTMRKSENLQINKDSIRLVKTQEEAFSFKIKNYSDLSEFEKIVEGVIPSPAELKILELKEKRRANKAKEEIARLSKGGNKEEDSVIENNWESFAENLGVDIGAL